MGQGGKRLPRMRGPVGLGKGFKFQQLSWFDAGWGATGEQKRVACIFFATNERQLDRGDWFQLSRLADHYAIRLHHGMSVDLSFIGRADARYYEDYNKRLSEDRARVVAEEVEEQLRQRLQAGGAEHRMRAYKGSIAGFGEWFAVARPDSWANDRRVDVYEVRPQEIENLKEALRKLAERGIRRYATGIRRYRERVAEYKKRIARGPNAVYFSNLVELDYFESRVKQLQSDYEGYIDAIGKGDRAFLDWLNRERPGQLERAERLITRYTKLKEKVRRELQKAATAEDRRFLKETGEFLDSCIAGVKDDIKFLEREQRWEEEREAARQASAREAGR
jgi:hypothetical protein